MRAGGFGAKRAGGRVECQSSTGVWPSRKNLGLGQGNYEIARRDIAVDAAGRFGHANMNRSNPQQTGRGVQDGQMNERGTKF